MSSQSSGTGEKPPEGSAEVPSNKKSALAQLRETSHRRARSAEQDASDAKSPAAESAQRKSAKSTSSRRETTSPQNSNSPAASPASASPDHTPPRSPRRRRSSAGATVGADAVADADSHGFIRSALEVFQQLQDDPRLAALRAHTIVGYTFTSRGGGSSVLETPLAAYSLRDHITPFHRIVYFKCKGTVVWDKRKRIDILSQLLGDKPNESSASGGSSPAQSPAATPAPSVPVPSARALHRSSSMDGSALSSGGKRGKKQSRSAPTTPVLSASSSPPTSTNSFLSQLNASVLSDSASAGAFLSRFGAFAILQPEQSTAAAVSAAQPEGVEGFRLACPASTIPDTLLVQVFDHLDSNTANTLALVSKEWRRCVRSGWLWKQWFMRQWPSTKATSPRAAGASSAPSSIELDEPPSTLGHTAAASSLSLLPQQRQQHASAPLAINRGEGKAQRSVASAGEQNADREDGDEAPANDTGWDSDEEWDGQEGVQWRECFRSRRLILAWANQFEGRSDAIREKLAEKSAAASSSLSAPPASALAAPSPSSRSVDAAAADSFDDPGDSKASVISAERKNRAGQNDSASRDPERPDRLERKLSSNRQAQPQSQQQQQQLPPPARRAPSVDSPSESRSTGGAGVGSSSSSADRKRRGSKDSKPQRVAAEDEEVPAAVERERERKQMRRSAERERVPASPASATSNAEDAVSTPSDRRPSPSERGTPQRARRNSHDEDWVPSLYAQGRRAHSDSKRLLAAQASPASARSANDDSFDVVPPRLPLSKAASSDSIAFFRANSTGPASGAGAGAGAAASWSRLSSSPPIASSLLSGSPPVTSFVPTGSAGSAGATGAESAERANGPPRTLSSVSWPAGASAPSAHSLAQAAHAKATAAALSSARKALGVTFDVDSKRAREEREGAPRKPIPLLLKGHRGVVTAIQFDRTKLAFSSGKFVRLFSLATGRNLGNIKGNFGDVACIDFSPQVLVSGSTDRTLRTYDWDTLECKRATAKKNGHRDTVTCVKLTAGSRNMVSAGLDATVKIWDTEQGQCSSTFNDSDAANIGGIIAMDYLSDKEYVTGSSNARSEGRVTLWDARVKTGVVQALTVDCGLVSAVKVYLPSYALAAGGSDGLLRCYDLRHMEQNKPLKFVCSERRASGSDSGAAAAAAQPLPAANAAPPGETPAARARREAQQQHVMLRNIVRSVHIDSSRIIACQQKAVSVFQSLSDRPIGDSFMPYAHKVRHFSLNDFSAYTTDAEVPHNDFHCMRYNAQDDVLALATTDCVMVWGSQAALTRTDAAVALPEHVGESWARLGGDDSSFSIGDGDFKRTGSGAGAAGFGRGALSSEDDAARKSAHRRSDRRDHNRREKRENNSRRAAKQGKGGASAGAGSGAGDKADGKRRASDRERDNESDDESEAAAARRDPSTLTRNNAEDEDFWRDWGFPGRRPPRKNKR